MSASTLRLLGCGGGSGDSGTRSPAGSGESLPLGLPAGATPWQREWQELADLLMLWHPRPFAHCPRADFVAAASRLMTLLPFMGNDAAYLALMRCLSLIADGHCFIQFPWRDGAEAHALPFAVHAFEEGLFVTALEAGRPELAELAGAQVLAYGGTPAQEALAQAARYLPAENPWMARHYGALALRSGLLLADAGLSSSAGVVALSLRLADGSQVERRVDTGPLRELALSCQAEPMRHLRQPALDYWAQWLNPQVFYLRYQRCRDAAAFEQLIRTEFSAAAMVNAQRVVVDLRGNGGGDSAVVAPLVEALRRLGLVGARLAVLSDRATLSAAVDALIDLRELGARHVGEPPGQRPNFNGNARRLTSGSGLLQFNVPTSYHPRWPGDPAELSPHHAVPLRFADWPLQRDAMLALALSAA